MDHKNRKSNPYLCKRFTELYPHDEKLYSDLKSYIETERKVFENLIDVYETWDQSQNEYDNMKKKTHKKSMIKNLAIQIYSEEKKFFDFIITILSKVSEQTKVA